MHYNAELEARGKHIYLYAQDIVQQEPEIEAIHYTFGDISKLLLVGEKAINDFQKNLRTKIKREDVFAKQTFG